MAKPHAAMGEFALAAPSKCRVIPGTENPPAQRRAALAAIVHRATGRDDLLELAAMLGLDVDELRASA